MSIYFKSRRLTPLCLFRCYRWAAFRQFIDSQKLSLDAHVASVCRSSYYQLKQLRPVARSLSVETAKTLVQAFVSSRLDYCNAILHGLPEKLMRRLQSAQNAAARMITSARRRDHITPILRQLHWLPVRQRVDFKMGVYHIGHKPYRPRPHRPHEKTISAKRNNHIGHRKYTAI